MSEKFSIMIHEGESGKRVEFDLTLYSELVKMPDNVHSAEH